jgi:hypothetical protein
VPDIVHLRTKTLIKIGTGMYFVLKIKLIVMTDWSVENMNPGIAQNWRLLNVSALPKLSKTYIQHLILVSLLEPMVGEVFTSISIHQKNL